MTQWNRGNRGCTSFWQPNLKLCKSILGDDRLRVMRSCYFVRSGDAFRDGQTLVVVGLWVERGPGEKLKLGFTWHEQNP